MRSHVAIRFFYIFPPRFIVSCGKSLGISLGRIMVSERDNSVMDIFRHDDTISILVRLPVTPFPFAIKGKIEGFKKHTVETFRNLVTVILGQC